MMTKEIDVSEMMMYAKALHCGIRWQIIEVLRDGSKSSDEILRRNSEKSLFSPQKGAWHLCFRKFFLIPVDNETDNVVIYSLGVGLLHMFFRCASLLYFLI